MFDDVVESKEDTLIHPERVASIASLKQRGGRQNMDIKSIRVLVSRVNYQEVSRIWNLKTKGRDRKNRKQKKATKNDVPTD